MRWKSLVHRALLVSCSLMSAETRLGAQTAAVQADFQRGAEALHAGQLAVAEQAFRNAVHLAPQLAEAHLDLGLVLGREGKMPEAIDSLRQAIALDPAISSAHMFLGVFLYGSNQPEAARQELHAELTNHPDNVETLTWLGTVDLAAGRPEQAILSLDRAASLAPDDLNILELRGRAHSMVSRDSYARMARLAPGDWHVHRVQAQLDADEGKHAEAIAEYQAAVALQPSNPDLYEGLGDEYRSMNQLEEALTAYRKGLELGLGNPVALYNLGSTEVQKGESAAGVQRLRSFVALYPGAPVAEYYLGRGLAALGQDTEAIQWLEKASAADGSGEVAKRSSYELLRLYRKQHRSEEARRMLARYTRLRGQGDKGSDPEAGSWQHLNETAPNPASAGPK